ncbi:MAG TPA: nucleoside deaminase [Acidimicrobiia bacterium]|nr:nucleoside deaminase [Acidimicrobiia bacterium]
MNLHEALVDSEFLALHMNHALDLARQSLPTDIPIGAVIVSLENNEVISEGFNTRQQSHDATDHAEVIAIRRACEKLSSKRLNDCVIFTTLEPCIMCAGSLIQAHIGAVVFGAHDPQYGAAGSIYNFFVDPRLSHNATVIGGILEEECSTLVNEFFESVRKTNPVTP